MKAIVWIFTFIFLYPLNSFAVSLGLYIQALYDEEVQFLIGLKMEVLENNIPKAKEYYLKAIKNKYASAANRMAVLSEKEGRIHEAIQFHEKAVALDTWSMHSGFPLLSGVTNPSQWVSYDGIRLEIPSSEAASALALAEIHRREGYSTTPLNIKKSDVWYDQAFRARMPAVIIGVSLMNFGENEKALKWFARALKEGMYIPYVHYKMGSCSKALEKYGEAIFSYKKVMQSELQTEEDYIIATRAAFEIGRIYRQGIPELDAPPMYDLAENSYKEALQIGRNGTELLEQHLITREKNHQKQLGKEERIGLSRKIEIMDIAARQMGVARHIAEDYHEAYLKSEREVDLRNASHWYQTAHHDREISSEQYQQAVEALKSRKPYADPKPPVKLEIPMELEAPARTCQQIWGV